MTTGEVIALIKAFGGSGGGSSGGGALVVELTYDENEQEYNGDKTAGECWNAYSAGESVLLHYLHLPGGGTGREDNYYSVIYAIKRSDGFEFKFYEPNSGNIVYASASTENDYIHTYME